MNTTFKWQWNYLNPVAPPINRQFREWINYIALFINFMFLYPICKVAFGVLSYPKSDFWIPPASIVSMLLIITPYILTIIILKIITDFIVCKKNNSIN